MAHHIYVLESNTTTGRWLCYLSRARPSIRTPGVLRRPAGHWRRQCTRLIGDCIHALQCSRLLPGHKFRVKRLLAHPSWVVRYTIYKRPERVSPGSVLSSNCMSFGSIFQDAKARLFSIGRGPLALYEVARPQDTK